MQVQHPGDKSPLEPGPHPLEHVEASTRKLHPPLKVNDVQGRAQVPVGQRLKVELFGLTPGAHHHVFALVAAHRHALVGHVGHLEQGVVQLLFHLAHLVVQPLDALAHFPHLLDEGLASVVVFHLSDLFGDSVAPGFQSFHFGEQPPPLLVQAQYFINGGCGVQLDQGLFDQIRVLADESQIQHDDMFTSLKQKASCPFDRLRALPQKRTRSVRLSWCHLFSPLPHGSGLSGCGYTRRDNGRIRLGVLWWAGALLPPFHPATREGISAVSGCRLPAPATLWKPRAAYLSPSLSLDIFDQDYITGTVACQLSFLRGLSYVELGAGWPGAQKLV